MRLSHDITDIERRVSVIEEQILHINDTDNIILCLLIDRKPSELIFPEDIDQLFIGVLHICKCHMYPGYHDVLGVGVPQVEHVVDQLFFAGFDHAVLMADVHNRAKLILGHALLAGVRIYPEQEHDPA